MLHERTNLLKEWDESRNFPLTPDTVSYGSKKKSGGRVKTAIRADDGACALRGSGCPYCAGRKVLPGFNDLETLCPGVAAQWHPSLNGALTPEMVTPGSSKKVWWQCSMGHVWNPSSIRAPARSSAAAPSAPERPDAKPSKLSPRRRAKDKENFRR